MESESNRLITSVLSWLCLFGGLGLLAALSLDKPVSEWVRAEESARVGELEAVAAEDAVQRLEETTRALKSNDVFRDQWMRREWSLPSDPDVETISNSGRFDPNVGDSSFAPRAVEPIARGFEGLGLTNREHLIATGIAILMLGIGLIGPALRRKPRRHPRSSLQRWLSERYHNSGANRAA